MHIIATNSFMLLKQSSGNKKIIMFIYIHSLYIYIIYIYICICIYAVKKGFFLRDSKCILIIHGSFLMSIHIYTYIHVYITYI